MRSPVSAEPKARRSVSSVASRRRGLRSPTRMQGDGGDLATAAHPLDTFYAAAGLPLPRLQAVDGRTVAQPYRRLLVHTRDMTPTLESFHGGAIDLEVLQRRLHGSEYFRQVILRLSGTGRAVEFGANRVFLDAFPARVRQAILAEREISLAPLVELPRKVNAICPNTGGQLEGHPHMTRLGRSRLADHRLISFSQ